MQTYRKLGVYWHIASMVKVILGFGNGNVENGCEHITVEIRDDYEKLVAQDSGSLPAYPELWELYESWKSSIKTNFSGRIKVIEEDRRNISQHQLQLSKYFHQFPKRFNQWLDCDGFRSIEKLLRNYLNIENQINFTVEAENHEPTDSQTPENQ